jgi:hypothetical protein
MRSNQPAINPDIIRNRPFTPLAWLHLAVIILIWASPFLFSWWLIVAGIFLYFMQLIFLGDCLLTRRQFFTKKRSITFYYYIITKFGFKPNGYHIRFLADYIMPPIILGWTLVWQLGFDKKPPIL